jgi:serine/threonine protein kinase
VPIPSLSDALQQRYAIVRELGRGGMATVNLARDLRHDRPVALKVLHQELAASLGPERFLREIRITAQLQHPHILPLLDSGGESSLLWYTMPYVEGENLRQRIAREKQLSIDDTILIARQVASAIGYAHGRGIVHRDIKPENILIDASGAMVADFGIARAVTAAADEKLTSTGIVVGTPAYMSPEQGASGHDVDARSDLYSLGCVMYEMLAGQPPFSAPTAQGLLARHAVDPVPSLRTVRPTVPAAVERAVEKALAKVPADRFRSADELSASLSAPEATVAVPSRAPSRRRWPVAAAIVGAAGLAAAVLLRSHSAGPQCRGHGTRATWARSGSDREPHARWRRRHSDGGRAHGARSVLRSGRLVPRERPSHGASAGRGQRPARERAASRPAGASRPRPLHQ